MSGGSGAPQQSAMTNAPHVDYDAMFDAGYMSDWPREKLQRVADLLAKMSLPNTGDALDYGCGTGVFTAVIASVLPGWRIHGVDISSVAVQRASGRMPNATFTTIDDHPDERRYDLVFTHHVLEHVDDLDNSLRWMAAVMRPGARALHVMPCGDVGSLEHWVANARRSGYRDGACFVFEDPTHVRRIRSDQLVTAQRKVGVLTERVLHASALFGSLARLSGTAVPAQIGATFRPGDGRRVSDRVRLWLLYACGWGLWMLRAPLEFMRRHRSRPTQPRSLIICAVCVPLWPFSCVVDRGVRWLAEWEWQRRAGRGVGSEMYLMCRRADQ